MLVAACCSTCIGMYRWKLDLEQLFVHFERRGFLDSDNQFFRVLVLILDRDLCQLDV